MINETKLLGLLEAKKNDLSVSLKELDKLLLVKKQALLNEKRIEIAGIEGEISAYKICLNTAK